MRESNVRGAGQRGEEPIYAERFKLKFYCEINWNPEIERDDHIYVDGHFGLEEAGKWMRKSMWSLTKS